MLADIYKSVSICFKRYERVLMRNNTWRRRLLSSEARYAFYDTNVCMSINVSSCIIEYQLILKCVLVNCNHVYFEALNRYEKTYYNHCSSAYHVWVYCINEYILIVFVYKLLALPCARERDFLGLWESSWVSPQAIKIVRGYGNC